MTYHFNFITLRGKAVRKPMALPACIPQSVDCYNITCGSRVRIGCYPLSCVAHINNFLTAHVALIYLMMLLFSPYMGILWQGRTCVIGLPCVAHVIPH
jgi:hypothetical protein